LIDDADIIAPVPLHWTRLLARRYNQSALLAGVVGEVSAVTVVQDLLMRKSGRRRKGEWGSRNAAAMYRAPSRSIRPGAKTSPITAFC